MTDVMIRGAGPADIPAIARIYAHAVENGTATFELEPPDEAEMARRQQVLLGRNYPYLVAERRGMVLGYAYAGPYRDRRAYDWCVEDSIYIAPEFHRQGLGRLLLARLVSAAEEAGFRQIVAVIGDSAQTASIAVHARAGFTHVGTLRAVGFKHGRWLDTVLMQRPLGRGDTTPP
ncbi:MAG TPA: GNAT family N-acetyltransferase [Xanthobacteraceae bacterium]|nr:GNAT family N-acetyltransferase [Xanthobacteraceae bacterium]